MSVLSHSQHQQTPGPSMPNASGPPPGFPPPLSYPPQQPGQFSQPSTQPPFQQQPPQQQHNTIPGLYSGTVGQQPSMGSALSGPPGQLAAGSVGASGSFPASGSDTRSGDFPLRPNGNGAQGPYQGPAPSGQTYATAPPPPTQAQANPLAGLAGLDMGSLQDLLAATAPLLGASASAPPPAQQSTQVFGSAYSAPPPATAPVQAAAAPRPAGGSGDGSEPSSVDLLNLLARPLPSTSAAAVAPLLPTTPADAVQPQRPAAAAAAGPSDPRFAASIAPSSAAASATDPRLAAAAPPGAFRFGGTGGTFSAPPGAQRFGR